MFELIKPHTKINFLGVRKEFYIISGILILISLITMAVRTYTNGAPLNYGIDFTGGTEIQLTFKENVPSEQVRSTMSAMGFEAEVQSIDTGGNLHNYLIRIRQQVTVIDKAMADKLQPSIEAKLGKVVRFEAAPSGDRVYVNFEKEPDQDALKGVFTGMNLKVLEIEKTGRPQDWNYTVHLEELQTKIAAHFQQNFGPKFSEVARVQLVGPKAGKQLRDAGILSVFIVLLLISAYVALRFDFRYSVGALLSLFHDPVIIMGCFSLFWWEFTLTGIAALLTIVGYSINDTIIVFDRIREVVGSSHDKDLVRTANQALNDTLSRTLLTSGATSLVVVAILIFGGSLLREFAVVLMIGIVVGTYSSIGVASAAMIDTDRIMPKLQAFFAPKKAPASSASKNA